MLKLPLVLVRVLFVVAWSVVWITAAVVMTLLTLNREVALRLARTVWAPGILWGCGVELEVEPLPDFDWSTPHIFTMNHQSMLDIPCAFAALPVNLRFVAKHTLAYVPFLGWYMALTGMVFINRSERRKALASLKLAGERIRGGANILAYPEGTRTLDGAILPFKKGPFALAAEARVPIVPVAIDGSSRALPAKTLWILGGRVRLKVGPPLVTDSLPLVTRDVLLHQTRAALIRLHRDIGGKGGDSRDVAVEGTEGIAVPL